MENTDWSAFEAVWDRVSAASSPSPKKKAPPPAPSKEDASQLRIFLQETSEAENAYRAAAGRTSLRWLKELCEKLRRQKSIQTRRLQSAYFLLTGDTCPLPQKPEAGYPVLELLRGRLLQERSSAAAFHAACKETGDMELSRLYRELAAENTRSGELLRTAISRLFR